MMNVLGLGTSKTYTLIFFVDLSGEKVEIPSGLISGPPPPTNDFFFSDLSFDTQV